MNVPFQGKYAPLSDEHLSTRGNNVNCIGEHDSYTRKLTLKNKDENQRKLLSGRVELIFIGMNKVCAAKFSMVICGLYETKFSPTIFLLY